jgi:hypothetical protein
MAAVNRFCWHRSRFPLLILLLVLLVGALIAAAIGQRTGCAWYRHCSPEAPLPLDDWDIPQFVAYLNGKGLGLRLVSTLKNGRIGQSAFLTTRDLEWMDLNPLSKAPKHIDQWRGTLYCERGVSEPNWSRLTGQWGDRWLAVGPFLLYGDRELLARVRAAIKTR